MSIIGEKFTIKYAPKSFDDLIIPERIRTKLKEGATQHLLLYGSPGTGKTTTARLLAQSFGIPYLEIDASTDTGINVLRNQISTFCSTMSLTESSFKYSKIVILDEIDGISKEFSKALKATTERFEKNTIFLATTNHINEVADTLLSRFHQVNYDFSEEEESEMMRGYIKRIYTIAKDEGMTFDKDALVEFVQRSFPDMRSMLNSLQGYYDEGISHITLEIVKKFQGVYKDVFELIFNSKDSVENYKFLVSNYSNKVDDILSNLGNQFIEYLKLEHPELTYKIPEIIINVAEYQAQRKNVIDEVVTLLACVFKIQSILKQ